MRTFTLLIILAVILCIIAFIIIKNILAKNESLAHDQNLIEWEKSRNSKNNTEDENLISKDNKNSTIENTSNESDFSDSKYLVDKDKAKTPSKPSEKSNDSNVNKSKTIECGLNIDDKKNKEVKEDYLNQNEEANDLVKKRRKYQSKETTNKDLENKNFDLEKTEIKTQEQVKEEINDKKISSPEKVKAANSHIKEVDDFINNIEDIDSLKKSSPKLCQKENYDSKLDFHKSITTGGMDEFEKTEIQIKTGDYNLFDVVEFIKNTKTLPTKISKKKLLTLQYSSTNKEDIRKILSNNKIIDEKELNALNENSSVNSTIIIDKENNKITEVTDSINYSDSKRTIFSKFY
ncbi:hypothetical protein [Peptoniphilus lacrimalis]|uniref:Uncharacterized protein n=1 Tax=Peptoniphilus lacrimalis TaxID=33031 RepID=A0A379C6W6_9FIRM|nr:hypothetical protein [Peptoniphilus lacrimalis]SUB57859.1 Uncharacterised protein [Peptoniphilus lacrimalis]